MVKRNWTLAASAGVAGTALVAGFTVAGPLNPPAGPIAPTYKTLAEVEPRVAVQSLPGAAEALYVISQPGSYYLTGDIVGVPGKHAIRVEASDVTLDLMGFTIVAVDGQLPDHGAIVALSAEKNLTIRNGTLRGFGNFVTGGGVGGVRADLATGCRLEDLRVMQCHGYGLSVGPGGAVARCVVEGGHHGIRVVSRGVVSECVVRTCTGNGINVEAGFQGDDALIANCKVFGALGTGIRCGGTGTVSACSAALNEGMGIVVMGGGTVTGCTAARNLDVGIYGEYGVTISGCTAHENSGDGIQVHGDCLVIGNTCDYNGFGTIKSGIGVFNGANRVEGNNVTHNDFGIATAALGSGNLFIRNSAAFNTTAAYSIGPGNAAGTIVTAATIGSNTSPHANYAF